MTSLRGPRRVPPARVPRRRRIRRVARAEHSIVSDAGWRPVVTAALGESFTRTRAPGGLSLGCDRRGAQITSGSMSIGELELDVIASETRFSGVVGVERGGRLEIVKAYGQAHRGYDIPNEVDTRFALASGTKGLTALTVVSLVEGGTLRLTTTARSVLGRDIPLVGKGVTVEHLLA